MDAFWYTLDNDQTNISITELTGIIDENAWYSTQNGPATIRFYARDKSNNVGYSEVIVVKLTPSSGGQGIPGYDLLVLLGIICSISAILIKKRRKSIE